MCFGPVGFAKLKLLGIDIFDELRRIQVEVGTLPRLEKLWIQQCKSMEKVPLGIEHLTKLKVPEFFYMPQDFIKTLISDEQGDYWRVAHILEEYSTYWRDWGWEVYSLGGLFNDSPRPSPVIRSQELYTRWK